MSHDRSRAGKNENNNNNNNNNNNKEEKGNDLAFHLALFFFGRIFLGKSFFSPETTTMQPLKKPPPRRRTDTKPSTESLGESEMGRL